MFRQNIKTKAVPVFTTDTALPFALSLSAIVAYISCHVPVCICPKIFPALPRAGFGKSFSRSIKIYTFFRIFAQNDTNTLKIWLRQISRTVKS